ncbi:MAG: hypothetical protein HC785_30315 [Calothrix sp. CSU_2_0]|nr:hypothetical protein [Calothrix sp. CSU_2_0]
MNSIIASIWSVPMCDTEGDALRIAPSNQQPKGMVVGVACGVSHLQNFL